MVRPKHTAWIGFEEIRVPGKSKSQARCLKCGQIYVNPEKSRLLNHK